MDSFYLDYPLSLSRKSPYFEQKAQSLDIYLAP